MRCKIAENELFLYAENALSADRINHVESHIEDCSECREFLVFLKESLKIVEKDREIIHSPFLYTRILAKMDSSAKFNRRHAKRLVSAFAFPLIFLAVIFGGVSLGKIYADRRPVYTNDLQEEISYLDDLRQESIETFFLTSNNVDNE